MKAGSDPRSAALEMKAGRVLEQVGDLKTSSIDNHLTGGREKGVLHIKLTYLP